MINAHLVCETHWDREWYLTKEEFGVKLTRLMDRLIDIVEKTPGYVSFMMDGQTIALEDYLRIRPGKLDRLQAAVASGKIAIGPWYVLPDELLVSGESHIRNWFAGDRVVEQFGRKSNVGYLPDSFGHPEQMPQILKGLGIDTIVFWRGTSNQVKKTEFRWASPKAITEVLGVHMPCGYGNCARLSADMNVTIPRLNAMIDTLRQRSTGDVVLLMNGSDHILPQTDITDIIATFNAAAPADRQILFSTLNSFLEDLGSRSLELETHSGEFRSGDRDMILGGTLSTRVYLKQRNLKVQRAMERCLEPLAAIETLVMPASSHRNGDFADYQKVLWKKILENHPHDSICGCSVDAVHEEMLTRYDCIDQLQDTLTADLFASIEANLLPGTGNGDVQLLHFENSQDRLPAYHEFDVDFDATLVNKVNFEKSIIEDYEPEIRHPAVPVAITARDNLGREIQCALISGHKAYHMDLQDETLPEVYKVNRCRVGLLLPAFDFGLHLIRLQRADLTPALPPTVSGKISNEFYEVEFDPSNAGFRVLDKATGRLHEGVSTVCDLSDAGDEYTYSWVEQEQRFSLDPRHLSSRISICEGMYQEIILEGDLMLPESVTEDRKARSGKLRACPLFLRVRLYNGINRVDFRLEIENTVMDHRLQIEIPSGVLVQSASSSTAFALTERIVESPLPAHWMEYPQDTHPTHGFIHAGTPEYGVSVSSESSNEFESLIQDGQTWLHLTLLRCVGWLSRPDLKARKGNGGWSLPTPGAQCLGRHSFEYGLVYHRGGISQAGSFGLIDRKQHACVPAQLRKAPAGAATPVNPVAFVSDLPPMVRMSAFKLREDGKGLVFRIYSIDTQVRKFVLKLPEMIRRVNAITLDERVIGPMVLHGTSIEVEIRPAEILSFEFLS